MPMEEERRKPQSVPGRRENKRWAQKRNDESQTVDLMPAWGVTLPPFSWSLLANSDACRSSEKAKSPTFTAANLPFEETDVAQRCDGVVKRKRKAEGSGKLCM
jgi:hypothetical protein